MSCFLLIPGAGGAGWYWHRVVAELRLAGHVAIAPDLPGDDPSAGPREYADLVVDAAAGQDDVVLVAQSMGGFTAVPACRRLPVRRLILLNAMIPAPGETAGDWGEHTGSEPARVAAARAGGYPEAFDAETYFFHDVPPEVVAAAEALKRPELDVAFEQPCDFERWPEVETTVLCGRDDRLFPAAFQRRVARERLGLDAREIPGGHLAALSQPQAVTAALL
ncbi:alpha/beta fold hydrolase [Candidatus Solirubrobacter pratensis]|uniref:alpha/beta fold hydrolase n=1 Tax=Candidatus Solirubrobacter pratensis TaxID=1298857 RepID=UPI000412EE56|nr:alpha/beta fold hydrolase [Candidatus Solirubrobacter pratensis]